MTAYYHLPGLFEFFELYSVFLPLYGAHREYFYEWCEIASVYGAPADCLWDGGRTGYGDDDPREVLSLLRGLILIIPAALVMAALWDMTGVWLACPDAELLVAMLGVWLYRRSGRVLLSAGA